MQHYHPIKDSRPKMARNKERASVFTLLTFGIVARTVSTQRNQTPRIATGRKSTLLRTVSRIIQKRYGAGPFHLE